MTFKKTWNSLFYKKREKRFQHKIYFTKVEFTASGHSGHKSSVSDFRGANGSLGLKFGAQAEIRFGAQIKSSGCEIKFELT